MNGCAMLPEDLDLFRFKEPVDEIRDRSWHRGSAYVGAAAIQSCPEGASNLDESMDESAKTESITEQF